MITYATKDILQRAVTYFNVIPLNVPENVSVVASTYIGMFPLYCV
jgi:hypothetical protein